MSKLDSSLTHNTHKGVKPLPPQVLTRPKPLPVHAVNNLILLLLGREIRPRLIEICIKWDTNPVLTGSYQVRLRWVQLRLHCRREQLDDPDVVCHW